MEVYSYILCNYCIVTFIGVVLRMACFKLNEDGSCRRPEIEIARPLIEYAIRFGKIKINDSTHLGSIRGKHVENIFVNSINRLLEKWSGEHYEIHDNGVYKFKEEDRWNIMTALENYYQENHLGSYNQTLKLRRGMVY